MYLKKGKNKVSISNFAKIKYNTLNKVGFGNTGDFSAWSLKWVVVAYSEALHINR